MPRQKALIEVDVQDKASAKLKNVNAQVVNLGKTAKTAAKTQNQAFKDTTGTLEGLGNQFRYLSLVTGMLSAGVVMMAKSFVDAARDAEAAMMKLGTMAATTGASMDDANAAAMRLHLTGFMSLSKASEGLANILATGIGLERAEKLMTRFLDASLLVKESITDTAETASVKGSQGFRILQERMVDATGINFRLDNVIRDYGRTLGKTTAQMTQYEKHMGLYNFLMKESERYVGGAELAATSFGGAISKLGASINMLKISLGQTLIPIVGELTEILQRAAIWFTTITDKFPAITSAFLVGAVAVTVFVTAIATLGAIIPMLTVGMAGLTIFGVGAMTVAFLKFAVILAGVSLLIGGLTYAVLKLTGTWDKWRDNVKDISKRIAEIFGPVDILTEKFEVNEKQLKKVNQQIMLTTRGFKEGLAEWVRDHDESITDIKSQIEDLSISYKDAMDDITGSFDDSMGDLEIRHARKVEDLDRQLKEEISKGIWADQTKIRNLQRTLKRENEDYDRAKKQNIARKDDEVLEETKIYATKLEKLKDELEEEVKLRDKHQALLDKYGIAEIAILDEIEKKHRTFIETLVNLGEQRKEILGLTNDETTAINNQTIAINNKLKAAQEAIIGMSELMASTQTSFSPIYQSTPSTWGLPPSQPQQNPFQFSPTGGSSIININNPSVRSDQDILSIATAVSDILSRQTYYQRFT